MSLYQGTNNWIDDVYLVETTDVVIGGPNGVSNQSTKELSDRTQWLRNALRGYNGVTVVNGAQSLSKTDVLLKLVILMVNAGTAVVDLPALTSDDTGLRVSLTSFSAKQLTINSPVPITCSSSEDRTRLYIADGEKIELIWTGAKYILLDYSGNLISVGEFGHAYKLKPNTIVADGSLLLRADYPRLFEFVQSLSSSIVSESAWNTVAGNKGFFTIGTNPTNFRIPDLRSMFIRSLDLGAGIDFGRNNENPGGYEADEFKNHSHVLPGGLTGQDYSADRGSSRNSRDAGNPSTTSVGGSETRPKNIGLIPFLYV